MLPPDVEDGCRSQLQDRLVEVFNCRSALHASVGRHGRIDRAMPQDLSNYLVAAWIGAQIKHGPKMAEQVSIHVDTKFFEKRAPDLDTEADDGFVLAVHARKQPGVRGVAKTRAKLLQVNFEEPNCVLRELEFQRFARLGLLARNCDVYDPPAAVPRPTQVLLEINTCEVAESHRRHKEQFDDKRALDLESITLRTAVGLPNAGELLRWEAQQSLHQSLVIKGTQAGAIFLSHAGLAGRQFPAELF